MMEQELVEIHPSSSGIHDKDVTTNSGQVSMSNQLESNGGLGEDDDHCDVVNIATSSSGTSNSAIP